MSRRIRKMWALPEFLEDRKFSAVQIQRRQLWEHSDRAGDFPVLVMTPEALREIRREAWMVARFDDAPNLATLRDEEELNKYLAEEERVDNE